jgi:hypothetical protein
LLCFAIIFIFVSFVGMTGCLPKVTAIWMGTFLMC